MKTGPVSDPDTLSAYIADEMEANIAGFSRVAGAAAIECIGNAVVTYLKDHLNISVPGVAPGSSTVDAEVD